MSQGLSFTCDAIFIRFDVDLLSSASEERLNLEAACSSSSTPDESRILKSVKEEYLHPSKT